MDNLTHSLFGLTLARAAPGRAWRGTSLTLLLASNAPDIDIVTTAGGSLNYLEWHRGPTHGPLGVVGLSLITALLVWGGSRLRADPRPPLQTTPFLVLWAIAAAGVVCHVLMDLPTSYGTRALSPFDWHWFAEDWMPIVDIYLLLALAAGLLLGRRSPAARRRGAAFALLFMLGNYGLRAAAHHQAIAQAPRHFGSLLPAPCTDEVSQVWIDRWPRTDHIPAAPDAALERERSSKRCLVEIAAMPDFLSPFHWRVIAHLANAYEVQDISLLATAPAANWRPSARHANQWTPAVTAAAQTRVGRVFLGFSRFPSVRSVVEPDGEATVVWNDLRFVTTGADGRLPPRSNLFSATVRFDGRGVVVEEKLGP